MNTSNILRIVLVVIAIASLNFSLSARADDPSAGMLGQAADLVHQAWNPGGDPLPDAQRTDLLTKALKLTQQAPNHHLQQHRVQAMNDIKLALDEIKNGDPNHKAADYIRDADSELRTALSIAQ